MKVIPVPLSLPISNDKENLPPPPPPPPPPRSLPLARFAGGQNFSRKNTIPKVAMVPREPLADITHLFIDIPRVRSCSLSRDVVTYRMLFDCCSYISRKRRALGDVDLIRTAQSKSLRMGFR